MRYISAEKIVNKVKEAVITANIELSEDMNQMLKKAVEKEESEIGKQILYQLIRNAEIAKKERIPMCQDTGIVNVIIEMGQEVVVKDGYLMDAIKEGVKRGYTEGYLRKSVCHPITRQNTMDNTPPIVHVEIVPGDKFTLWIFPKGGGAENKSRLYMLLPTDGWEGIKNKVIETVIQAGASACPPLIVGVGIGGNFETAPFLAKKALLRPLNSKNSDPQIAKIEQELLEEINKTGIGPQGMGGRITAFAVHINMMPCHIASLPVAVNIQCHSHRVIKIEL